MKKLLAFLLISIIFCLVGCNGEDSETQQKKSSSKDETAKIASTSDQTVKDNSSKKNNTYTALYKPYVQKFIDEDVHIAQCALYDLNDDKLEELILMFTRDTGTPTEEYVYSIYTIKNDKVTALIENEYFLTIAGGPSADVSILENDEQVLVSFYTGNGSNDGAQLCWKIYSYDCSQLKLEKDIVMHKSFNEMDDGTISEDSYAVVNGEKCEGSTVEDYFNGFKKTIVLEWNIVDERLAENFINTL